MKWFSKIGTYYVPTWQLWFEIPIIKWSAKICTYVLCGNSGTFCGKSETHKWYGNLIRSEEKKKCTRVCVYYKNYARFRQKSIKSAKSTHPENSKLVRQVHVVQKVPPGSMIEQKNGFCENTIFVKNYLQKKVHLHLWISCKIC